MASTSKKYIFAVLIILGVIGIVMYSQGFSLLGREIWIPRYLTGECVPRADNGATIQILSHTDDGTFYHCTTEESGKWIPIVVGVECKYRVSDFSSISVYTCDGITENRNDLDDSSKCIRGLAVTSQITSAPRDFSIDSGDTIYINTNKIVGTARLSVEYPSYGIRLRGGDNFVSPTTNNCLLNSIDGREFHTIDASDRLEIIPDVPFNAVSGLNRAISTQAVILPDVENGRPIYISRPNHYHVIRTAEDGFEYVDTTIEFTSNKIECIPRTTGCSDDAKIIPLGGQSCDRYGGAITGYSPVQGDPTRLCKYSCSGGTLSRTNDCITIQDSCPPDEPLWDTTTGLCTSNVSPIGTSEEFNAKPLFIILIIFLIAVLMIMLYKKKK